MLVNSTHVVVENNVLGAVRAASVLLLGSCVSTTPAMIDSYKNNAIVSSDPFPTAVLGYDGTSCGSKGFATVSTVAAACSEFGGNSANCGGDVLVGSCTAGTEPNCAALSACTTNGFTAFFSAWDASTPAGSSTLLTGGGWQLATSDSCRVTRSSLDDSATVTTDLYGNPRPAKTATAGPSMGAHQQNGACM